MPDDEQIYTLRPTHRHGFGILFVVAETEEDALSKTKNLPTPYGGSNYEVTGTMDEYIEETMERGYSSELYKR